MEDAVGDGRREYRATYLVTRFPKTTETFVYREIAELRRLGRSIDLAYLVDQGDGIRQPETACFAGDAFGGAKVSTLIRSLVTWSRRKPRATATVVGRVVRSSGRSLPVLGRDLLAVLHGLSLANEMERRGTTVIHAHFASFAATAASAASQVLEIPYTVTVHAHELYADRTGLAARLERAATVITISEFNQRMLADEVGVRNTSLVRCGLELESFASLASSRPLPATRPGWAVLSVGRLADLKGHKHLIDACGQLKNQGFPVTCDIVGSGPLHAELQDRIDALDLSDDVVLHGSKSSPEVLEALAEANCFVLACDIAEDGNMDGIPVALMEAMAAQVPVVSTKVSGVAELVMDMETGLLVSPADPVELAEAIAMLADDPELANKLARNGADHVRSKFDIRESCRRLDDVFHHVTKRADDR